MCTHHGERIAEQDQELGQDLLPHASLELDQAADAANTAGRRRMSDCHFCRIPASDGDSSGKDLHGYADDELGHVAGLPELYAKTQKVHAELVTKGKTKKEIKFNLSLMLCTFDKKQRCGDDSLLLRGEDFKGASREHLIEHVEKGNGHPRGGQIQGHARHLTFSLILNVV